MILNLVFTNFFHWTLTTLEHEIITIDRINSEYANSIKHLMFNM